MVSFSAWLKKQKKRPDAVGDLARDVCRDPDWPARARKLLTFRRYLQDCGACEGAMESLERAWAEY